MKLYIETPRLILRDWKEDDMLPFARMNKDEEVMKFFLKKLTYSESLDFYYRIETEFDVRGYGLYAVEKKEDNSFIGFVGLHDITFDIDFAPGIEIGWRLLPEAWGKGYATEAATACLQYAKDKLGMKEVFSFTSLPNEKSERVMQKLGMERVKEFNHPLVNPEHALYKHVLYRVNL